MTDKRMPASTPSPHGGPSRSVPAKDQGTAGVVKDQAAGLGQGSAQAGKHVAEVTREQASGVAAEAGRQGKDLIRQGQHQLEAQAAQGQQRLAKQLISFSDELRSMADASDQSGMAADLAQQAAERVHRAGQWLDNRRPREVAEEMQSFARRRPGVFLVLAAGAGLVAGRFTRGLKDQGDDFGAPPARHGLSEQGAQWAQPADLAGYPQPSAAGVSGEPQNAAVPATSLPPVDSALASQAGLAYGERSPLATDDQAGREGAQ